MWEKDRRLLKAFTECYSKMNTGLLEGEDIDVSTTCVGETEALIAHTIKHINYYKTKHPSELSDKKSRYYTPKLPYFQNL